MTIIGLKTGDNGIQGLSWLTPTTTTSPHPPLHFLSPSFLPAKLWFSFFLHVFWHIIACWAPLHSLSPFKKCFYDLSIFTTHPLSCYQYFSASPNPLSLLLRIFPERWVPIGMHLLFLPRVEVSLLLHAHTQTQTHMRKTSSVKWWWRLIKRCD